MHSNMEKCPLFFHSGSQVPVSTVGDMAGADNFFSKLWEYFENKLYPFFLRNSCQDRIECLRTLFQTLSQFVELIQFRVDFPVFCVWRLTVSIISVCSFLANPSVMNTLCYTASSKHFCVNMGMHFQRNGQEIGMKNVSE